MKERPKDGDVSDMLTVKDICEKLQISRWMVNELRRRGRLQSVKIGSRRLFPRHALETYEKRLEEEGGGPDYGGQTS